HADREERHYTTTAPHHGVAVPLPDGTLVVSEGTSEARTGAQALDADDAVIATSSDCPDLHGEGVAAAEAVVFGCADGALVFKDGAFTKLTAPEPRGRISTLYAVEESAVALGDYEVEGASENRLVALVNTAAGTISTVELPTAYYGFNDAARTEDGGAMVLGLDGVLYMIDVEAATVTAAYPVIAPYETPQTWQEPAPKLLVLDGMVYITEPAAKKIHVVDPATGELWKSVDLDVVPGEIQGVSGDSEAEHDHDHEEDEGHEEEEGQED
ncbi:MAG: hypothetical protein LBE08_05775, partial [Bifidobacteriaceae bacterium]|nr:hypothetical protein [Bifidobacteriaceae bacterium]